MKLYTNRLILCLLILAAMPVSAQQFKWIHGGGSSADMTHYAHDDQEQTNYMCTDAQGNVYALSQVGFTDIVADTFHRASAYSASNLLITSYTCDGQMRWAKLITSSDGDDLACGIGVDNNGHVYVAGFFQVGSGTVYIGYDTTISGVSSEYLSTALLQLDTAGHFKWIRFVGNNSVATEHGSSGNGVFALDGANNAHFFNYLGHGVPFMPGDTSRTGEYDLVYNSGGTLLSATRLGLDSMWYLNCAVIDPATNKLYVSGQINQYIYGSTPITDTFFAAAFDPSRNLLWQYFTGNDTQAAGISGITIDENKFLHLSGAVETYSVTVHTAFSFNGMTVSDSHYPYIYAMSVVFTTDTNGTPIWMKKFDASTSINTFNGITNLPHGKIAVTGTYAGTVTDGITTIITPTGEGQNPYIVVVDSEGDLQDIQQIHGDGFSNGGHCITSDTVGNIYVGGYTADSEWVGTPPLPAYHTVGGNTDFFITKYGVDCACTYRPVAAFTDTGSRVVGTTYTGTTRGMDSVVWSFGDGSHATGLTSLHTYTTVGTFQLCSTVYTACGRDSICKDVTVICVAPPTASFTDTGIYRTGVTYTGTTYLLDSVEWSYGDGHGSDTGITAHHTYSATGTYTVCSIAFTGCGNDTVCHPVTVPCVLPPVSALSFTGTTSITTTYTGATAALDSVGWNFGDGIRGSGLTSSHTYAATGIYQVCAISHSPCGADTACLYDTVTCVSLPTVAFTDTGFLNIGVAFTASTTAIDSIGWNFGDGYRDTGLTSLHTYTAVGIYNLCATAYSACGNTTVCINDTIPCVTAPTASFTASGRDTITFNYSSTTGGMDSVIWDFGDGTTGSGLTPTHIYTASGTYHACVTIYTLCGLDSFCRNIIVTRHNVGIVDIQEQTINVFPNPVDDNLTITGIQQTTGYRMLNVLGEKQAEGTLKPGENTVSMKSYAPGVYILEMTGQDGVKNVVRVIKE